jgi:hypothetical protein
LNKTRALWKASLLQLRIYMWCMVGVAAAGVLANLIVALSMGGSHESKQLSAANVLTVFLIIIAVVLPVSFFKRVINLGASRKEYYISLLVIYSIWTSIFALLNIIFWRLESGLIAHYQQSINILVVFHWVQFGVLGMFVYQFCVYMLLITLLNLLFSGLRHFAGWVIWVVLITAIPIGTSLPSLRPKVADAFLTLLFNDSLLQGAGLAFLLSCVFLAGGWLFTRRRMV